MKRVIYIAQQLGRALRFMAREVPGHSDEKAAEQFYSISSALQRYVEIVMPSGSGFDAGTKLDLDRSTPEKLVFTTQFHHMDDHGYAGWTQHSVTVRPSFQFGVDTTVSGTNRNGIKDYIAECFHTMLVEEEPNEWPVERRDEYKPQPV